jgi:tRNA A-37 threonylcarbamoyl transferase component Bud32
MAEALRCPECGDELASDAPEGLCPACLMEQGLGEQAGAPPSKVRLGSTTPHPFQFVPPEPAVLSEHFPQLEILELLGQGGMGAVYKARQTKLDRLVALKILPPEWGRDSAFAERFNREARALARLTHPNTTAVHDFGEIGGFYYFIMEFVDGASLRQLLASGPLSTQETVRIVSQVCDALQYAHEEGIVHRDVKPENILLDRKGRVKIADFGLAKLMGGLPDRFSLTGSRQVMGTPHYMAPEQIERPHTVDHRVDVYALGVCFYEMLTGELPLGRFPPPSQKASVDERLDEVVLRALENRPDRRYQRVSEVKADMEALGAALSAPASPAPTRSLQEEIERELFRLQVKGPAIGLILTAILAFLLWAAAISGMVSAVFLEERSRAVYYPQRGWAYEPISAAEWYLILGGATLGMLAALAASAVLIAGARRMMRFQNYEFVIVAAIFALLPWSAAFPLGVAMGSWALYVLRKPDVRLTFIRNAVEARLSVSPPASPSSRADGNPRSFFQSVVSLFVSRRR